MDNIAKYFDKSTLQQIADYSDNKNCPFADKYNFQFIPKGSPIKTGIKFTPKKIITRNSGTGLNKPAIEDVKYLYSHAKSLNTCPHFIVDDKEIWQINPEDEVIIHSGSDINKISHTETILVTFCNYLGANQDKVAKNTADLVAFLMKKYNIQSEAVYLIPTEYV